MTLNQMQVERVPESGVASGEGCSVVAGVTRACPGSGREPTAF